VILQRVGPAISKLCISPDGNRLAVAQRNGVVNFWAGDARETLELKLPEPPRGGGTHFEALAFSPNGRALVTSAYQLDSALWDLTTGKQLRHLGPVGKIAYSPDGRTVVVAIDRRLDFINPDDGTVRISIHIDGMTPYGVAFSPDGATLAVCHYRGTIT